MSNVVIEKVLNGKLLEYTYFLYREGEKKCICVDPGYGEEKVLEFIEKKGYIIDFILLTHGHFDHMLSCSAIQKKFNSKVYISDEDSKILYNAEQNYAFIINKTNFEEFKVDIVKDNQILNILDFKIKCISTPGHTKGGMSYYVMDEDILFSGDTLFYETYGRTDLYSGSYEDIKNSILNKLFLLPNEVKVYPGHGYITSIGKEKIHNEIRSN